jgi:hypothetical protein
MASVVALVAGVGGFGYLAIHRAVPQPSGPDAISRVQQQFLKGPRGVARPPDSWETERLKALQNYLQVHFPPVVDMRIVVAGPTGTPVVVGYRLDGSSDGRVVRGLIPTNWVVRARRKIEVAVKNVGNTNAHLGCGIEPVAQRVRDLRGIFFCPPCYGFAGESHWGGMRDGGSMGGTLMPTNWPVTLPPAMTAEQVRTNDFERDLTEIKLEFAYMRAAANPQDFLALMDIAGINWWLKNYPAAEEAYQRFFTNECSNSEFWNQATYSYVNHRGTNVERAYELALKALEMSRGSPYIADTVAWIQVKRGYYREAVSRLPDPDDRRAWWNGGSAEVRFHKGFAHYMLLEEEPARQALEKFVADKSDFPGRAEAKAEAKACLAVLAVKTAASRSGAIASLRARLAEEPDDPIALDRLAEYFESDASEGRLLEDPLVLKAVGLRAYRKWDYTRATQYLAESIKSWTGDGEGFLYLGLAQNHLEQTNECVESLHKAKSLPLKAAQIAEVDEVLKALARQ